MELNKQIEEAWAQARFQKKEMLDFFGSEENYKEHIRRWAIREGFPPEHNYTDIVFDLNFGEPVYESLDDSTLEP